MCSLYRKCVNIIGAIIKVEVSFKICNVTRAILNSQEYLTLTS